MGSNLHLYSAIACLTSAKSVPVKHKMYLDSLAKSDPVQANLDLSSDGKPLGRAGASALVAAAKGKSLLPTIGAIAAARTGPELTEDIVQVFV